MQNFIQIATLDQFSDRESLSLRVENLVIALFKLSSGEIVAIENSCPHIGAPLDNGILEDDNITCLWHGWSFNVKTGESTNCKGVQIKTYTVKIKNNEIWIKL